MARVSTPGPVRADARGADEDHLQRAAGEGGLRGEDGGVDLAAVGVALDGDVECAERALRRVFDCGEQDGSGAGAEGGRGADVVWRISKKPLRSRNLSMVVDSPPGMMRPSSPARWAGCGRGAGRRRGR